MECFVVDSSGSRMKLVDVDGYRVCTFDREAADEGNLTRSIRDFPCRADDIFLLAPVKSGTHWTWEIAGMLLKGSPETMPTSKAKQMLEHETPETLTSMPSPRILNSHLKLSLLPRQLLEKNCKVIYVLRDPRDMLVSWYNHCKGVRCYEYSGSWNGFFDLFMNDELEYGSYWRYVREWQTFIRENPGYPVHVLYYEDLHKDNVGEISRLANFLGVDASEKLIQAISDKCQFQNMHKDKMYPDELRKMVFVGDFTMYRKGKIGDWKNYFTVKQKEMFEQKMVNEWKDLQLPYNSS